MCLNSLNPPINWVPRCLRFPETSLKPSIESSNQLGDPDHYPKWGWWKTCRNCPLIGGYWWYMGLPCFNQNLLPAPTPSRACHGSSRCARGHCHLDLGRHRTNCGPPGWLSLDRRNWGPPNIRESTVVPKKRTKISMSLWPIQYPPGLPVSSGFLPAKDSWLTQVQHGDLSIQTIKTCGSHKI